MPEMRTPIIAAYAEGEFYPPALASHLAGTRRAGWNTLILGLFHVSARGDISFNDVPVFEAGRYVGDPAWPADVASLLDAGQGSTIRTLAASFGGGGVSDFANIQAIYEANGRAFEGTALQANFEALARALPPISIVDMDVEEHIPVAPFAAFCAMLSDLGFGVTFCPFTDANFWTEALVALQRSHPGLVKWWNLQAYDGGSGNDPSWWAQQIEAALPGFDTRRFIVPGDWSRNLARRSASSASWYWRGDCPQAVQRLMRSYSAMPAVGGGFLWAIDQIILYATLQHQKPDPIPCASQDQADYARAIRAGLTPD